MVCWFSVDAAIATRILVVVKSYAPPALCLWCVCTGCLYAVPVAATLTAHTQLTCLPTPPPCRSITTYKGNYDVFVKTAEERLRNATKAAEAQAAKRAHVQVRAAAACCVWAASLCTCR
jgi:hypothetical protein